MGLEWHNRKRATNGRFTAHRIALEQGGAGTVQLHVRVSRALSDRIRAHAIAQRQEISTFVAEACADWCDVLDDDE